MFKIFFLVVISSLFLCYALKSGTPRKIRAIELVCEIPLVNVKTGVEQKLKDSFKIYYFDDLVFYRKPYQHTTYSESNLINDTIVVNSEKYKSVTRFRNLIYREKELRGLQYDSISSKLKLFEVDSLLRADAFKGLKFYDERNDILKETVKYEQGKKILEKYIPKFKIDETYCDTTYIFLKKGFESVPFSFSKKLDSIKKMKVCEVRFIYNELVKSSLANITIPRRVFSFKIKELNVQNQEEIMSFFNRFKRDRKTLKNR